MPIDAAELKEASPWHPMADTVTLKIFGKLQEELGELQAALARCVIQGLEESEPRTGKLNREWLADEIADVLCGINLLLESYFSPDHWFGYIEMRRLKKEKHLRAWHKLA